MTTITIEIPDNLPPSFIQQGIAAFKETLRQLQNEDELKIDPEMCLKTLAKIKQGDFSGFTEIEDVDIYIQNLRNEISEV